MKGFFVKMGIFISLYLINGFTIIIAQESIPDYLEDYSYLKSKDQKAWSKELENIKKADMILSNSNQRYIDLYNVENDPSLSDKKKASEKQKIQEDAFNMSREALINYKDAYQAMHNILLEYVDESVERHNAYLEVSYYQQKASTGYENAGKVNSEVELESVITANENQLLAIEKLIVAISSPSEDYVVPTEEVSVPQIESTEEVIVNTAMYQMYQDYINDKSIADPITIGFITTTYGEDLVPSDFNEILNNYMSGMPATESDEPGIPSDSSMMAIANDTEISEDVKVADDEVSKVITEEAPIEKEIKPSEIIRTEETTQKPQLSLLKPAVTSSSFNLIDSDAIELRVQIAASRVQLSMPQIKAIYKGSCSVIEIVEEGYYKYQIRAFKSIAEAQNVISNSGVEMAYLEAYSKDGRIKLSEAVKAIKNNEAQNTGKKEYAVQVAASRVRLSSVMLESIYSGEHPVALILEEGWYKYHILVGTDYQKAKEIAEHTSVPKAFVVTYMSGLKIK